MIFQKHKYRSFKMHICDLKTQTLNTANTNMKI